jgi:RNA polymerase sigma-70 factor (ECF subfamily)
MSPEDIGNRLSRIQTVWSLVFQANQGEKDAAVAAQQELLLRYRGAVYRYLLGALRDPDAADELAQEFAVRFLQGSFRRADPHRGRFRDLVKTAVRHLMIDHWRRQGKAPAQAGSAMHLEEEPAEVEDGDEPFLARWREELLAHAWQALEATEGRTGQPYHTVLRWKTESVQAHSDELAARLSARLGRPFSDNALRKLLYRARLLFADLLVEEVARSLPTADTDEVERELIELGLLEPCKSALAQRRAGGAIRTGGATGPLPAQSQGAPAAPSP